MSTDTNTNPKTEEIQLDPSLKELMDAGVFYGRKKSKTHPRMKGAILSNRNGIEIINIEKTKAGIDAAVEFLGNRIRQGGNVMFVGTQPPAHEISAVAKEFGMPSVDSRWLGGTLTNHKVILGRIEYFKKLKNDSEQGLLDRYTKKERVMMEKELEKMKEVMTGLEAYNNLPEVLVVVDSNVHSIAVREAKHMHIPVIALVNTDSDPDLVDYPVVGNTKAKTSINWFLGKMADAIRKTRMSNQAAS